MRMAFAIFALDVFSHVRGSRNYASLAHFPPLMPLDG